VKRFLLFLSLVGAAVYLLTPPRASPEEEAEAMSAAQAQADHGSGPLITSWGSSLRDLRQERVAWSGSQQLASSEATGSVPGPHKEKKRSQPTRGARSSVPVDGAAAPTIDDIEREAVEWVRTTHAVRARSKASVSSPGLRFYPVGSKAQVVGRENGWVQLLDPRTQERGWVYHSYLASIDGPSAVQPEAASKRPVKVASPRSRKPTRTKPTIRTLDAVKVTKAERRNDRQARRAERRRWFGLFGRRQAQQAWSIGPAR
jgi:hypothetical protein